MRIYAIKQLPFGIDDEWTSLIEFYVNKTRATNRAEELTKQDVDNHSVGYEYGNKYVVVEVNATEE
jgi:hypothetical protein